MPHAIPRGMDQRPPTIRIIGALVGESLREVAVLVAVFGPLDVIVQEKSLTPDYLLRIIVLVAALFAVAFVLEVKCHSTR